MWIFCSESRVYELCSPPPKIHVPIIRWSHGVSLVTFMVFWCLNSGYILFELLLVGFSSITVLTQGKVTPVRSKCRAPRVPVHSCPSTSQEPLRATKPQFFQSFCCTRCIANTWPTYALSGEIWDRRESWKLSRSHEQALVTWRVADDHRRVLAASAVWAEALCYWAAARPRTWLVAAYYLMSSISLLNFELAPMFK